MPTGLLAALFALGLAAAPAVAPPLSAAAPVSAIPTLAGKATDTATAPGPVSTVAEPTVAEPTAVDPTPPETWTGGW